MSTITKESITDTIEGLEHLANRGIQSVYIDMAIAGMRRLLASLEAEPAIHRWRRVTVEPYGPYPWHYGNFIGFSKPVEGIEDEYFYSAPPAPVSVPDEATPDNIQMLASTYAPRGVTYQWDRDECNAAADSWNACRAAMLQGDENTESPTTMKTAPALDYSPKIAESPSGTSQVIQDGFCVAAKTSIPVISDGWVVCSERMPEDGEKVLTSFRGGMRTAVCKVIDVLGHKIFVDELTLFNGVPADHWQPLPAVPKLE